MAVSQLGVKPLKMILSYKAKATVDLLMKEMASEVDYHFKDYSNNTTVDLTEIIIIIGTIVNINDLYCCS